jgi:hypothetical protein
MFNNFNIGAKVTKNFSQYCKKELKFLLFFMGCSGIVGLSKKHAPQKSVLNCQKL